MSCYFCLMFLWTGLTCGEIFFQDTGVITSPNYPQEYPPDLNCLYLVRIHSAETIRVTITDFYTESAKDVLDFGTSPSLERLESWEGNLTSSLPIVVEVSSNLLWFQFSSDKNNNFKGFRLEYISGKFVLIFSKFGM